MDTSIAAFLRRKGAIELMCVVDGDDSSGRFSEIDEALVISHSTLSKRLDEAQALGLINVSLNESTSVNGHIYRTTNLGKNVKRQLIEEGVPKTRTKLRTVEELFEEQSKEVLEWAEELDAKLVEAAENSDKDLSPIDGRIVGMVVDDLRGRVY